MKMDKRQKKKKKMVYTDADFTVIRLSVEISIIYWTLPGFCLCGWHQKECCPHF